MPRTPMEPQADELAAHRLFLRIQHDALREKLAGLTDEQAISKPTASDLCMLTLVKHAAFCERRWMRAVDAPRSRAASTCERSRLSIEL